MTRCSRICRAGVAVIALGAALLSPAALAQETKNNREQAAAINTELAIAYMREENLAAARDKIEKALQQHAHTARTQMVAGFVYDRLGEKRKATGHYDQAAKLAKGDPDVLNNAGAYFCRIGQYRRGEEMLLQAAGSALYRTPDVAYGNAGRCARGDGRPKDAEKYFRKALSINPKQGDALWQMAEIAQGQGNGLQARAFLERYDAVAPSTAATLWLGRSIELGLGDTAQAALYARRLRDEFPTSEEAARLFEEERKQP
jgi:type IV pilus assembly protein PilF